MPSLGSIRYSNGYGKSAEVGVNLESVAGIQDGFVTRYDSSGRAIWSARIAAVSTVSYGYKVAVDSSDNVYVVGMVGSNATFYHADGTEYGPVQFTIGSTDGFIAKYSSAGVVQWTAKFGTTTGDIGYGIAVDNLGGIYVTGSSGAATMVAYNSNGSAFSPTVANAGGTDVFLVKYTSSGSVSWLTRISSTTADIGWTVTADSSGNAYIGGINGAAIATIYSATGVAFGTTIPASSGFVVKYNSSGIAQWMSRVAPGTVYAVAVDSSGNVYFGGQAGGTVTAYNSSGTSFGSLTPTTGQDGFVVKLNSTGAVLWFVFLISGQGTDSVRHMVTDSSDNLYVAGLMNSSGAAITIKNSNGTTFASLATVGGTEGVVIKYNSSGNGQWAARLGSVGEDFAYGVAVDSSGNVSITGQAANSASLNVYNANNTLFGTLTYSNLTAISAFLVRYNSSGAVQWAAKMGSSVNGTLTTGVSVDSGGNIYVTGYFNASYLSLYGNLLSFFLTIPNAGGTDAFMVKYNSNGAPQWAARVASSVADIGNAVLLNSDGTSYFCGQTGGVATIYDSTGTPFGTTIATNGSSDAFVVKFDAAGYVLWVTRIASTNADFARRVKTDSSGNLYVAVGCGNTGALTTTIYNSDGTTFGTVTTATGGTDTLLVKYNSDGFGQWASRISSSVNDNPSGLVVDPNGNIIIAGQNSGAATITAYNSDTTAFATTLTNIGGGDAYVVKYNSSGFVQWVTRIGTTGADNVNNIAVDSASNIYIAYTAAATLPTSIYSAGGALFATVTSLGNLDLILIKYNSSGIAQWYSRCAGTGADSAWSVSVDSSDNVILTGLYTGLVTITNSNASTYTTFNSSPGDSFMVKYNSAGFVQWVTRIANSTTTDSLRSTGTDGNGNIYVTASAGSTTTQTTILNPDTTTFGTPYGLMTLFKLDSSGYCKWIQSMSAAPDDISVNAYGDCLVCGSSASGVPVYIYNSDSSPYKVLSAIADQDSFVVKYSSDPAPQWGAIITSSGIDTGYGVATDSSGNVYTITQSGVIGVGNSIRIFNANGTVGQTLSSLNSSDFILAKHDTNGTVLWAARMGSTNADQGYAIATDSNGDVYVTGFMGNAIFGIYNANGTLFGTANTAGNNDCVIVKYNSSGTVQWFARVAGAAADAGFGIKIDSGNNVIITGQITTGTPQAQVFPSTSNTSASYTFTNSGSTDAFIVKLTGGGIFVWAARVASTSGEIGYGLAVDSSDNIFVTGSYGTAITTAFNSNGTSFATTLAASTSSTEIFLVKYNSSGFVQWITRYVSSGTSDIGYAVACDSAGSCYMLGQGASGTPYNSNGTTATGITVVGGNDMILIKYNSTGFVQWSTRIGGGGADTGISIAVDSGGNIYVAGIAATNNVLFSSANGTLTASPFVTTLGTGTFFAKYDSSGNVIWVSGMYGQGNDGPRAISVDSSGNIYIVGYLTAGIFTPSNA
jgi:hypothetical protein